MRTKNQTPFPFGFKVTSRRPPQRELSFIVRGTFVLEDGKLVPLETPRDLPEFARLEGVGEALNRLAQGSLEADRFAPEDEERKGEPMYPSDFADWKKNAEVMLRGHAHAHGSTGKEIVTKLSIGKWQKTLRAVSAPEPTPLDWAHTYGGEDFPANPVGTKSPSVIYASGRDDLPASYAPMNAAWALRAEKIGKKYDAEYARTRAPWYAEDFDAGYFHAAAPDQQLEGFLQGDETLRLEHLMASSRVVEAKLPALRIRVFIKTTDGQNKSLAMVLDTVFVDADAGLFYLTWRGLLPVVEDDHSDLGFAMIVSEDLASQPAADAAYLEQLDAFAKDPVGLVKPEDVSRLGDVGKDAAGNPAEPVDLSKPETLSALLEKMMGPAFTAHAPAFEKAISQALSAPGVKEKMAAKPDKGSPVAVGPSMKPGAKPKAAVGGHLAQVMQRTREAASAPRPEEEAVIARFEEAMKRAATAAGSSADQGNDAPGPGAKLAGRDFSGHDFTSFDLSGADLEGAILQDANLTGANLTGAKLSYAVLAGATLEGADLSGAELIGADFTRAKASGLKATRVVCDMCSFHEADLTGADLSEATGLMTSITGAKLDGARLERAKLEQATVDGCSLANASFAGAKLVRSLFRNVRAQGLVLEGAEIDRTSFLESDLTGARAARSRGTMPIFQKTELVNADFSGVAYVDAFVRELRAHAASFRGATLRMASFYRTSLQDADFTGADLMSADLRKTVLTGARFVEASLYDAKLIESAGTNVSFLGANLARANFERSKVVRL